LNQGDQTGSSPSKRKLFSISSPKKVKKIDLQSPFTWEPVEVLTMETDVVHQNDPTEREETDRIRNEFFKRKAREAKERKRQKAGKGTFSEVVNGGIAIPLAPGGLSPNMRPNQDSEGASEASAPKGKGE
jgi:hypothetical protein